MVLQVLKRSVSNLELETEQLTRHFKRFVKAAWKHFDPAPLVWGWHLDALCDHLQAVSDGRIKQLLINIPPGHAKSNIASVLWPAWMWTHRPHWRLLSASYERELATRDAVRARELIESPWYQARFRPTVHDSHNGTYKPRWSLKSDQNNKQNYENTMRGSRIALGVGGKATGFRGDAILIDDAMKAQDVHSSIARATVQRWWRETMATRVNNPQNRVRVVIGQRLHEDDLSGFILRNGGFQHLNLMSEYDPSKHCRTYSEDGKEFWSDPRKEKGEPLFPTMYPTSVLTQLKSPAELGSWAYAAQHQQNPVPAEGGMIKTAWLQKCWTRKPTAPLPENIRHLPTRFDEIGIFTDAAFKKTEESDRVAVVVAGRVGLDVYILDLRWERMSFTETVAAIKQLYAKWEPSFTAVEDKANGSAIMDVLRDTVPNLLPLEPQGSKEARVAASSRYYEGGHMYFPTDEEWPSGAQTKAAFVSEATTFPMGKNDDLIDALAYVTHRWLSGDRLSLYAAAFA